MAANQEKSRRMSLRREIGSRQIPEYPARQSHGPEYLGAYACFTCRKAWKMSPMKGGHICPECAAEVVEMGRSFKTPKKTDHDQWDKVEALWHAGFRFFSYRSYPDAEPLPERLRDVDDFIARNQDHPFRIVR